MYFEMIITVTLVNIHHHKCFKFFCLVIKNFNIYSVRNFSVYQSVPISIINYSHYLYFTSPGLIL